MNKKKIELKCLSKNILKNQGIIKVRQKLKC